MHGQYTHSNEHWACFRLSMCGISKFLPIIVIPKRPSNDSRLVWHFNKLHVINCASLIYYPDIIILIWGIGYFHSFSRFQQHRCVLWKWTIIRTVLAGLENFGFATSLKSCYTLILLVLNMNTSTDSFATWYIMHKKVELFGVDAYRVLVTEVIL